MNTVTLLTNRVDRESILKIFADFSSNYGKLWTGRLGDAADWEYCLNSWLNALSAFSQTQLIKAVDESIFTFKDFPPTLPQLLALCLKHSGIPSEIEVLNELVKKVILHPLTHMIGKEIGSWTLAHAKEEEMKSKIHKLYPSCLIEFRANEQKYWTDFKAKKDALLLNAPEHYKNNDAENIISLKERMKNIRRDAINDLGTPNPIEHQKFPENKIRRSNKGFDSKVFNEYKKYLLSVSECFAITLPPSYALDRVKFLYESETDKHLKEAGYSPERKDFVDTQPKRRQEKPVKIYKNWMND